MERHRHMRVPLTVLLAAWVLACPVPASAAASAPEPPHVSAAAPSLLAFDAHHPERVPSRSLLAVDRATSVGALANATRDYLRAALGPHALETTAESSAEDVVQQLFPMGDLDGDGRFDVVISRYDSVTGDVTLSGARGSDLERWWTMDAGVHAMQYLLGAADVTGDGAGDLVLLDLDFPSDLSVVGACAPFVGTACAITESYVWRVDLLDGRTGATLWTREIPGQAIFTEVIAGADPGVAAVHVERATNYAVLPLPSDGSLAISSISTSQDFAGERNVFTGTAWHVNWTYDAQVDLFAGTSPDVRASLSVTGAATPPLALPEGQFVGSPRGDYVLVSEREVDPQHDCGPLIAWCRGPKLVVDAIGIDGEDLAVRWNVTLDGSGEIGPMTSDLDGDGLPELWLTHSWSSVAFLSGATGATLWTMPYTSGFDVGSLDGGAGSDVVYATTSDWWIGKVYVERHDGATGALLDAPTQFARPTPFSRVWTWRLEGLPDVDGDHVRDLLLRIEWIDDWTNARVTESRILSGRTGAVLVDHAPSDGYLVASFYATPAPGTPFYYAYHDAAAPTLDALGADGAVLWTKTFDQAPQDQWPVSWLDLVPDMDGDHHEDLVFGTFAFDDPWHTFHSDLVDGATGSTRWVFTELS